MGADKAFVELDGRTLLARALKLAQTVASEVRIVGAAAKFAPFGRVVEDIFPGRGPLGGIHAALRSSATDLNVILAGDIPFVPSQFLRYMIEQAMNSPFATATVPRAVAGWQPLCAVYRREFAVVAENALRGGHNKIDALFNLVPMRVIEEDQLISAGIAPAIFANLNTPEELEAVLRGSAR
jgi:molybdenum cofactor guanylyltransferase